MRNRIYIEITNRCNLSCDFCHGTRRPPRTMTPAEFETLALKLRGETDYLYLHVLGEPLLHPQLPEVLAIAHRLGFRTCLVTNGTLLPRQKDALLAAPGLHKLSVSLHSFEGSAQAAICPLTSTACGTLSCPCPKRVPSAPCACGTKAPPSAATPRL